MTPRLARAGAYLDIAAILLAYAAFGQEPALLGGGSQASGRGSLFTAGAPSFAFVGSPFALTQDVAARATPPKEVRGAGGEQGESPFHYREISDFFNIREAYSNVTKGEWEFEITLAWDTTSGSADAYGPLFSLKYGVTDTLHAEIEVDQIVLGQGGDQGNGELALIVFKEWWKEAEVLPAFATWGEMRIPSGEGSSGVDGELHFNVTKTLLPNFRGHFEGFLETANGARGGEDEDLRRAFQWGVGPGFDYSFSDDTIAAVNYLMRSSEEYGHHNQNILEFGLAQRIAQNQHLKFAVDVGLDGAGETPNLGAKILWSIEW